MNGLSRNETPPASSPCRKRGLADVTGHEENAQPGPNRRELGDELGTAHLRHHDVGQDEVESALVLAGERERLTAVARLENGVAALDENAPRERADRVLVLGEQDRLGSTGRARWRRRLRKRCGGVREQDRERRAPPGLRLDVDCPPALQHDPVHGREAEARAASRLLRREERLEGPCTGRLIHALAGVADAKAQRGRAIVLDGLGLDRQLSTRRHCVACVQRQVDQHLLELTGIGVDRPGLGSRDGDELDVLTDQAPQQLVGREHDPVDVDELELEHLAAAERKELPRQRRGPAGGAADLLGIGPRERPLRHRIEQQLAVAGDRRQEVVEVVSDAAGQATDRLEPLRTTKLLLQLAAP